MANFVIASLVVPTVVLPNIATSTLNGNSLVAFTQNPTASTWAKNSFEAAFNNATLTGTPSVLNGDGITAVAARFATGDLAFYEQSANGSTSVVDVTSELPAPAPAAAPTLFFDPWNNVDIAYVDTAGALVVLSASTTKAALHREHAHMTSDTTVTTLTPGTTTTFRLGQPSVAIAGTQGTIVATSSTGHAIAVSLNWTTSIQPPQISAPVDVTLQTGTGLVLGEPAVITNPTTTQLFAAITASGALAVFEASSAGAWSSQNLTLTTAAPLSSGSLATASNGQTTYVTDVAANGDVQLFSVAVGQEMANTVQAHINGGTTPSAWSYLDVTTSVKAAPIMSGNLTMSATTSALVIAGEASTGDLTTMTESLSSAAWVAIDVSRTATNAGVIVGPQIASAFIKGHLTLFTYQTGYIATEGVGVYAIPQSDWSRAISDGWPILADTGALGTPQAPWVGFITQGGVAQSPDFLLGQAITNGHRPVTWLSFWTVSGPQPGQPKTVLNYFTHGYQAGVWVATQISKYKALGDSTLPNWVILDPEGYPDNHSNLDAPGGSNAATFTTYASYWAAMLRGWAQGLASVNPALRPGVYAAQSEYRNYSLSAVPMPVFEAIAFGGGGPVPISGAQGPNVLGFIAFSASCTPQSTLTQEINTLKNPPWAGAFNTLQFNGGVYCAP